MVSPQLTYGDFWTEMSVKMSAGTFLRFQENLFCEIAGNFKVIAKFGFCNFSLEGLG